MVARHDECAVLGQVIEPFHPYAKEEVQDRADDEVLEKPVHRDRHPNRLAVREHSSQYCTLARPHQTASARTLRLIRGRGPRRWDEFARDLGGLGDPNRVTGRVAERAVAGPALVDRLLKDLGTGCACSLERGIHIVGREDQ